MNMRRSEQISIIAIIAVFLLGICWLAWVILRTPAPQPEADALGSGIIPATELAESDEQRYFPNPIPFTIAGQSWRASVANTLPLRIQGLSNTPFLPIDMVKWFDFESAGPHSIWMKDMRYPIDIVWLDQTGVVVHIEEAVDPDTFPQAFSSPVPAWYVVEANVGFIASTSLEIGSQITLPSY